MQIGMLAPIGAVNVLFIMARLIGGIRFKAAIVYLSILLLYIFVATYMMLFPMTFYAGDLSNPRLYTYYPPPLLLIANFTLLALETLRVIDNIPEPKNSVI